MCPDCTERRKKARDALMNAQFKEAAKQVAIGAAEMLGVKSKSASSASEKPKAGRKKQEK